MPESSARRIDSRLLFARLKNVGIHAQANVVELLIDRSVLISPKFSSAGPRLCHERFGAAVMSAKMLPPVAHGFTHFKLTIQPVWVRVKIQRGKTAAPLRGALWLPLRDAVSAALPAPVRKILLTI